MLALPRKVALLVTALAATILPGVAAADGLPVLGVEVGSDGVQSRSGDARYVTLRAGKRTLVARVDPAGGRVLATRLFPGRLTIPAVAYDGSASGLSADGRTLVLIRPRIAFPRADTTLVVLDTSNLHPSAAITLGGDFSFDAVSPHGRRIYLIHYTSPTDPSRYEVRSYDLRARRLQTEPITDPREPGERMRGQPITRTSSLDGRWAYTLYASNNGTPFVHALDTAQGAARCIDLDSLAGLDLTGARLHLEGTRLAVETGSGAASLVDRQTFEVGEPAAPDAGTHRSLVTSWLPLGSLAAVVAAAGLLTLFRKIRRSQLVRRSRPTG